MNKKSDFLDQIEDNFYPYYLYKEPTETKTINDLLDLASADIAILKDEKFMKNKKNYLIEVD